MVRTTSGVIADYESVDNPNRQKVGELNVYQAAMSFREIADRFGICKDRVRQIHDKAIRKLRAAMKGDG